METLAHDCLHRSYALVTRESEAAVLVVEHDFGAPTKKTEQTRTMPLLSLPTWLQPGRKLMGYVKRIWKHFPWAWRIGIGTILILRVVVHPFVPAVWDTPIKAAGIAIFFGTALWTSFPRIKNISDDPTRIGLYWAWGSIAAGVILIVPGLAAGAIPRWAEITSITGAGFLLASLPIFAVVSIMKSAITAVGPGTVITILVTLAVSMFLFPPVIVYLMTNGQWQKPYILGPPQANSNLVDLLSLVPPAALFIAPDIFRKILPWRKAKHATRKHLPNWLAGIALVFTSGYALALHLASSPPLNKSSLTGLPLAFLFVGAILWPLYKQIVISCWRLGIADAIKLQNWRRGQGVMFRQVRTTLKKVWNAQTKPVDDPAKPACQIRSPKTALQVSRTEGADSDKESDYASEGESARRGG